MPKLVVYNSKLRYIGNNPFAFGVGAHAFLACDRVGYLVAPIPDPAPYI
ncbi:MAG: hypothetical protein AAFZ91_15535 [Pseudomonadota bacterium]